MAPGVSGNVTSIPKIKSQLSDFLAAFCKIFLFLIFQSPPFSIFDHTPVCRIRSLTGLIHVPLPLFQIFVFFRTSISYIYSLIYTSCFRILILFSSVWPILQIDFYELFGYWLWAKICENIFLLLLGNKKTVSPVLTDSTLSLSDFGLTDFRGRYGHVSSTLSFSIFFYQICPVSFKYASSPSQPETTSR